MFRQESNFYYLSGCTIPSSFLVATYQPGISPTNPPSAELFIPQANLADMMWSVPPPSREAAQKTHDVTTVDYSQSLPDTISALVKAHPDALFHTLPRNSPSFPVLSEEYVNLILGDGNGAVTDFYLLDALQLSRLTKDAAEIEVIRQANAISSRAHEVVMRVLGLAVQKKIERGKDLGRPLLPGEWLIEKEAEAEAIFVASCRREGYWPFIFH